MGVVGVHTDSEIALHKREPAMKNEQRMAAVSACKWVDEVEFGVPYVPSRELLNKLNCDYVAHGDDIPIAADGHSAYQFIMDKLKIFRRTPGVSTTHLIQRLIDAAGAADRSGFISSDYNQTKQADQAQTELIETTSSWSQFLASSSRISAFSNNLSPTSDDIVIYIDGIFDLFHIGHIAALKAAKQLGTFLFVGLYDDETVRARKGKYFPLMNLQERVLNVLSCKYVDDILIGAPWKITKQVLKSLNIKYVVTTMNTKFAVNEFDRYDVPKKLGIFKELKTGSDYTTNDLMKTIIAKHEKLERENKQRVEKAKQYVNDSVYVQEKLGK